MNMLFLHDGTSVLSSWQIVVLAIAAAGAAGFTAGLLYRASAAVILSLVTAITGFFLTSSHGASVWQSVLYAMGLVTILQVGYLLGASLSVSLSSTKEKASLRGLVAALFKQKTAP